jgi:FMN phosphatase YigB (HAD superfamily)
MNVRVVFVDWHKTLSTSLFWQHRRGCRLSAADSARVRSFVFSRGELVQQWMRGATATEDVCTLVARGLGLGVQDLLADLEHSCRRFEFDDSASVEALQTIRDRGIKVVLATDNMDAFSRWTVPALDLTSIFDAILNSASFGVLKDDRVGGQSPFFGPWLTHQRIAPSEAVLIDDSPSASAAAIGLQIRLIENPGKLASVLAQLGVAPGTGAVAATKA